MGRGGDKASYTTRYQYHGTASRYPSSVTAGDAGNPAGSFTLNHAPTGELQSVRTPSGHKHEFRVTPLVGEVVFRSHPSLSLPPDSMYCIVGCRKVFE